MDWRRLLLYVVMTLKQIVVIVVSVSMCAFVIHIATITLFTLYLIADFLIPVFSTDMPMYPKMYLLFQIFVFIFVFVRRLQPVVIVTATLVAILSVILVVVETIVDEVISFVRSFDPAPPRGVKDGKWELVTTVRSSNNGWSRVAHRNAPSLSGQFCQVIICDSNLLDPFFPTNASIIYIVEVRRHTTLWKELVIWRVSMLNGGQKKLASAQIFAVDIPFRRHYNVDDLCCFQSADAVVITGAVIMPFDLLIYDIRFEKWGRYFDLGFGKVISITWLERLIDPNGKLQGWRMRVLDAKSSRAVHVPEWHLTMSNTIVELRIDKITIYPRASVISRKDVKFGSVASRRPYFKAMRTSDGLFGAYPRRRSGVINGPVSFYDESCHVYVYCANFQEAQQLDRRISTYISAIGNAPIKDLCPTIFDQRECIEGHANGAVYRLQLAPPSLKYLALKRIFESNPDFRESGSAEQLRQLTGVHGMDGHFGN